MKSFLRLFRYIWPQWPRLVIIFCTCLVMAVLLSASFVTVIPLLKVMMGEEGLHGWVNRKICDLQYGMDFYVPDATDITETGEDNIAYYLLVTNIREDSLAAAAGVAEGDRLIGTADNLVSDDTRQVIASHILTAIASSRDKNGIVIQYRRIDDNEGTVEHGQTVLKLPGRQTRSERLKWKAVEAIQWLAGFLPGDSSRHNREKAIRFIILAMAVVTVIRCTARFSQGYTAEKVVQTAVARLREDMFAHVMLMPVGFFSARGTSDTTSRMMNDMSVAGKGLKVLLGKAVREPLNAIAALCFASIISWQLTLIFLTGAPATLFLFGFFGRKIKRATRKYLTSSAIMLGRIQQAISSLRVVKVYNRQEYESQTYSTANRRLLKRFLRVSKVESATNPTMEVLAMMAGSAALLVGAHWVTNSRLESSAFFGLLILLGASAESVRKVSDVWSDIQQSNAAAERIFTVIDSPTEEQAPDAFEIQPLKNKLEFQNVVFTYPGANESALKGVNLTVPAGRTVAIVGPNGSGKTTLVNLIPRFYEPDSGAVLIDGRDICGATLASLRDQIGMVTQNVVTFNNTIAANIGYGREGATMDEIISAAKRAYCHEFIDLLPKGYETVIGEHGSGFSGGQLQRISIARAILKNPAILIFDEAMSQIDADSEAKIHQALSELMRGRTCFVIAHRFSTVISADTIVVMDKGTIVAEGRHDELIKDCCLYRSLYETQLMVPT